jgi:hypothetical protein
VSWQGVGKVRDRLFHGLVVPRSVRHSVGLCVSTGAGCSEPARLRRDGQGRLGAARAVWMSRVSCRVSSTLAGLMRELSRPWQQAITWSITAV